MLQAIFDKFYLNNLPGDRPPAKFVKGILLLYLALILQTINNVIDGFNFSATLFVFFAAGFLIFATGEGKAWARIILAGLIMLNISLLIFLLWYAYIFDKAHPNQAGFPVYLTIMFAAEVIIEFYALILIFTRQARPWFNKSNPNG